MSVSIAEVISAGGYDLSTVEDAKWLLAQVGELEELVEKAEELVEEHEDEENRKAELEYERGARWTKN